MPVRKRFGQHFLHDRGVIRRIIDVVAPEPGERIVEVGPGRGALTWGLLERAKRLDVIEIDRDLAAALKADPRAASGLKVHVENVLDTDFIRLRGSGEPLRIVGNLPYNISTPLLFRLLAQRAADCADVEKHPLWAAFRGTLNRHKTVSCIPADPVPIRVCDDAAATDFIRHAQTDAERFGDQRMP